MTPQNFLPGRRHATSFSNPMVGSCRLVLPLRRTSTAAASQLHTQSPATSRSLRSRAAPHLDDQPMRLNLPPAIGLATATAAAFSSTSYVWDRLAAPSPLVVGVSAFVPSSAFVGNSSRRMSTHSGSSASDVEEKTDGKVSASNGNSSDDGSRHPLSPLSNAFDHSWISHLDAETESSKRKASEYTRHDSSTEEFNRNKRPVFNGHYVKVKPTPLKNPRLVIHSPDMAERLGLDDKAVQSEEFTKFFSGDVGGALKKKGGDEINGASTWATPYALSIMGTRYTSNCPFGTGDGYGDGRAISIGEVAVSADHAEHPDACPRYEMQLKGGGPTPFCRGADGRAVLRSSIREFLASEAMHNLGIRTTRALSLVVSDGPGGDTSMRPWYSEGSQRELPSMDDPRLAQYSDAQKKQILSQLRVQARDNPDIMIEEPCAITCRVSSSFVRVGHLDLFARRATKNVKEDGWKKIYDTSTPEWEALEKLIWHAAYREFPKTAYEPFKAKDDIGSAAKALLEGSMDGIATMVAGWIRVGFTQGNFNADNCLVGGRTMDYGPFGFVDEYHPLYAKWTGSGEHFGFLNQPQAGFTNFAVMVESVFPVIVAHCGHDEAHAFKGKLMGEGAKIFQSKVDEAFRAKMGFHPTDDAADKLWADLEPLFRETRVDWTMFWRQLYEVVKKFPVDGTNPSTDYGDMMATLVANDSKRERSSPFYEPLNDESRSKYLKWIKKRREALVASHKNGGKSAKAISSGDDALSAEERMRLANPKYILREQTLVEAYGKAANGDEYMIKELLDLVERPYDEGTEEQSSKYYRRSPDEALKAGGTAFMS